MGKIVRWKVDSSDPGRWFRIGDTWHRGNHKILIAFPGSRLPWAVWLNGEMLRRSHGVYMGYRRFKTAPAAMLAITGYKTVFEVNPWASTG
jgi:hypothetical protein